CFSRLWKRFSVVATGLESDQPDVAAASAMTLAAVAAQRTLEFMSPHSLSGASKMRRSWSPGKRRPALLGAGRDRRVGVAVLGPGFLALARIDRTLLAVGDGRDAGRVHPVGDQEVAHRAGAAGAQGQVVLAGAAFVAVAL